MYKGAIIGGTGFERLGQKEGRREIFKTPFGEAELFLGDDLVFVSRHHANHSIAPGLVNFRANIWALKELGVKNVIASYCVGSITERLPPGTVGIVQDFVDFSKGRSNTFYDGSVFPLKHTDLTNLVDQDLADEFIKFAAKDNLPLSERRGIYVTTSGPRFETVAEIKAFKMLGCDYVGMTMGTEAPLCIEAGMRYLPIAFSINWAAGVHHTEISFLSDAKVLFLSQRITLTAIDTLTHYCETT